MDVLEKDLRDLGRVRAPDGFAARVLMAAGIPSWLGDSYTEDETPVGRFIERRGEGLHHIAYRVDEIEAALASARENRLMLVDDSPRRGSRNTRVAFVHPKTNHGVLVELVQAPAGGLPAPASELPVS